MTLNFLFAIPLRMPLWQCNRSTWPLSFMQRGRMVSISSSGRLIAPGKWPELNSPGLRTSITSAPFRKCASASLVEIRPMSVGKKMNATAIAMTKQIVQFTVLLSRRSSPLSAHNSFASLTSTGSAGHEMHSFFSLSRWPLINARLTSSLCECFHCISQSAHDFRPFL